jgi:hypothetical protein
VGWGCGWSSLESPTKKQGFTRQKQRFNQPKWGTQGVGIIQFFRDIWGCGLSYSSDLFIAGSYGTLPSDQPMVGEVLTYALT